VPRRKLTATALVKVLKVFIVVNIASAGVHTTAGCTTATATG
jgi:hypothetical protein